MDKFNQKINFHYKCKINGAIYIIQLFNIQQEKIKIMINTKNAYSDDYIEYSNIYTLIQFQEITKYFILFENIEEIFEDLSRNIQEKNFSIDPNGNTLTFTIKVILNKKEEDINFILDKNIVIDLTSKNEPSNFYNNIINNTTSSKNSDTNKKNPFSLEKSKRNVEISNINELNTLLSDLKDRIAILEESQNNQLFQNKIINNNNFNSIGNNENINNNLKNILIRLNKLENDNNNKDIVIEKLEEKLQYYESIDKNKNNNIIGNNNDFKSKNPGYLNTFPKNQILLNSYYNNNQFQAQSLPSLTIYKVESIKKYNNYKNYRLKQSKSDFYNNNNNEKISLESREMNINNHFRNNSYNEKKLSFRENIKSYGEETFRYKRTNNISYGNDKNSNLNSNSSISNYSNAKDKNFKKYLFYKEQLGIPMVNRENIKKYINSRIIFTKNELRFLKYKLSDNDKKNHIYFDLLYRASIDGDFEEVIKNNTEDKEKTLTLFYTYEGSRFGVFIHKKPSISIFKGKVYKEVPGTSFIFSLNNFKIFEISKDKTSKENIEDYLCFGRTYYLNKNGSNWLIYTPRSNFLKKKCSIGNQKGEYQFFDPEVLVGKKNEYHIKDVEIFHVVIE